MSLSLPYEHTASSACAWLAVVLITALAACHHRSSSTAKSPAPDEVRVGTEEPRQQGGRAGESDSADELGQVKVTQVEQLLEGRFAGVEVVRTRSGGYTVRIRGTTTILGDNQPLYVLNGLAVQVDPERGLDWLSPAEIERIEVLKGPETVFYGARGANGVILITTKKRR